MGFVRADPEGPDGQGKDPSILFQPMLVRLNWDSGKVGPAGESLEANTGMSVCSGRC